MAAVDAALAASRQEAVTLPKAQQTMADAGTLHHLQQADRGETADAVGLADPLVEAR